MESVFTDRRFPEWRRLKLKCNQNEERKKKEVEAALERSHSGHWR